MSLSRINRAAPPIKSKDMKPKMFIGLDDDDLLKIEQIVLDNDTEEALTFVKEIVKKRIDRENNSKMKRENT